MNTKTKVAFFLPALVLAASSVLAADACKANTSGQDATVALSPVASYLRFKQNAAPKNFCWGGPGTLASKGPLARRFENSYTAAKEQPCSAGVACAGSSVVAVR